MQKITRKNKRKQKRNRNQKNTPIQKNNGINTNFKRNNKTKKKGDTMNQKMQYTAQQRKIVYQINRNNIRLGYLRRKYLDLDVKNSLLKQELYTLFSEKQISTTKKENIYI